MGGLGGGGGAVWRAGFGWGWPEREAETAVYRRRDFRFSLIISNGRRELRFDCEKAAERYAGRNLEN